MIPSAHVLLERKKINKKVKLAEKKRKSIEPLPMGHLWTDVIKIAIIIYKMIGLLLWSHSYYTIDFDWSWEYIAFAVLYKSIDRSKRRQKVIQTISNFDELLMKRRWNIWNMFIEML